MNNKFLVLILIIGFFTSINGLSQEKLVSAGQNPVQAVEKSNFKSTVLLDLPFIEDFSGSSIYPDPSKWTDINAYINNFYPIDQPGYGVATLDGIDSLGKIYSFAGINSYRADFLSSQAINLDLGADSTVYLSFYFQAQGLGDAPEPTDSLVLEFYSPGTDSWNWAWSSPGQSVKNFKQVLVNINGAAYLQSGFRFRFLNYASLADSYVPSLKVNGDHWHLDYIYLNNNRNYQDTIIQDLSLIKPPGSLLLEYSSMPWEHFKSVGINAVSSLFPIKIQNLSGQRHYYTPLFNIENISSSNIEYEIELEAEEIRAFEKLNYEAPFNYGFSSDEQDSASFLVTLDLQPTEDDLIPGNTKLQTIQEFSNYYSYDDGSAEAGYGLVGEGANNGQVACRFENLVSSDSLIGLKMFFNRSFEDANQKYFNCAIWNEVDGKPGELLYKMSSLQAGLNMGLTEFDYFMLDTAQIVPSVFYIGWIQVTNDFLNVGFDKNNNKQDKIFYTMDGVWKTTSFEGSLMIRPVFANKSKKTSKRDIFLPRDENQIKIYPNPASSFINIDYPESWQNAKLNIVDIQGRIVLAEDRIKTQLNLPALSTGTYFLILQNTNGETHHMKLLITYE